MSAARTVHRRDLLLLRPGRAPRHGELSCQVLHLLYLDCLRTSACADVNVAHYEDPALGEPPSLTAPRQPADVLAELATQLESIDVVRVVDRAWITDENLARGLDRLLASVAARGGRVEVT